MLVYEKFSEQGLFKTMQEKGYLPIEYDDLSGEQIDMLYNNVHGIRKLARIGRDLTVDAIADLLGGMYAKKWELEFELSLKNADFLKGDVETIEENIVDDNTMTDERTTTNQVSAYNDDMFVNHDKDDSTNEVKTDNERNRTLKRYNQKIGDIKTLREVLQNSFLYDIIFTDVNTVLTLNIF